MIRCLQAAFYFVQLLKGVLAIHSHGFCHRDLKPENCMVERDSEKVKVRGGGRARARRMHLIVAG